MAQLEYLSNGVSVFLDWKVLRLLYKRKHFEVQAKIRTGNWWFYILLCLSEAMGIHLEQQLGQAFLLFPKNVKTVFEEFSLTKREKGGSSPCISADLQRVALHNASAQGPTVHTGTQQTWAPAESPSLGCAHTQTLPASPHSAMLQPWEMCPAGSSRQLL